MSKRQASKSRKRKRLERMREVVPLAGLDLSQVKYHAGRCRNKVDYGSEEEAVMAVKENEAKYGCEFEAYRCPFCGRWHLTTHPWREVG